MHHSMATGKSSMAIIFSSIYLRLFQIFEYSMIEKHRKFGYELSFEISILRSVLQQLRSQRIQLKAQ